MNAITKPSKTIKIIDDRGLQRSHGKDPHQLDNEMRDYANEISKAFPSRSLDIELEHFTFHYNLEPHYELMHYSYAKEFNLEDSFVSICNGKYELLDIDSSFPNTPEDILKPNKKEIKKFAENLAKICNQKLIRFTIQ